MSLETITEINLDVNQPGLEVVHAKQYDTVRKVKAHLFYNGVKWPVPQSNFVAVVSYKKADRIGGFYDQTEDSEIAVAVDSNDRSIVTILLDRNTVTVEGNCNVEITFYDSIQSGRLSTFSFILQVEAASLTELDLASNPYFNILADDIRAVLEAEQNLTGLTATASKKDPGSSPTVVVTGGQGTGTPYNLEFGIPEGLKGNTGDSASLKSSNITYVQSSNGTSVPSSGWSTSVPVVTPGNYLWTKIILTWNDNKTVTYYTVSRYGVDGSGSPGTIIPLPGNTNGDTGSSNSFSREDHRHPLPEASDIILENGTPIQTAINNLPTWRGKRALIIGDSWHGGWNGTTNVTPWTGKFLELTGINADRVVLSGGGFTLNGTGTYTSESFVSCLEHKKNETYDLIIVQGGVNDIVTGTASISDAIANFKTKCDSYFPNIPIYYIVTTPFYLLTGNDNTRALQLIQYGISNGLITCTESARFFLFNASYKGTDLYHPSQDGFNALGTYVATFVNNGVFPEEFNQISAWSQYASYINVAFSSNVTNGSQYTRINGTLINMSASFTGATTAGGWVTVMTGLPLSSVDYQNGIAFIDNNGNKTVIPVYVNNDELILDLGSNISINGKTVDVRVTYTTKSV